ncbi:TraR/DksA C4-type zinc finger protein [Serratia symbiotica]|uniref:TraR/DksA family transcriptional regulator n=1 Tax=Serratia symbiotica TaxID=138074 RepID=A0A068Z647_9GAMM|nr:TraR/DksA C4-type zinc finger protein [Serratia symbiotica]QLH61894.1 TraR/DksA family transcriptional regulator [Serratia symbiotica]CDS56574.1 conserved hypothetical protein [Serratia symbiotica]
MTDDLNDEMAQASTAMFTQRSIDAIRAQVHTALPSKEICGCCGVNIPLDRQLAVPGVELCAGCQDVKERRDWHHPASKKGMRYV